MTGDRSRERTAGRAMRPVPRQPPFACRSRNRGSRCRHACGYCDRVLPKGGSVNSGVKMSAFPQSSGARPHIEDEFWSGLAQLYFVSRQHLHFAGYFPPVEVSAICAGKISQSEEDRIFHLDCNQGMITTDFFILDCVERDCRTAIPAERQHRMPVEAKLLHAMYFRPTYMTDHDASRDARLSFGHGSTGRCRASISTLVLKQHGHGSGERSPPGRAPRSHYATNESQNHCTIRPLPARVEPALLTFDPRTFP